MNYTDSSSESFKPPSNNNPKPLHLQCQVKSNVVEPLKPTKHNYNDSSHIQVLQNSNIVHKKADIGLFQTKPFRKPVLKLFFSTTNFDSEPYGAGTTKQIFAIIKENCLKYHTCEIKIASLYNTVRLFEEGSFISIMNLFIRNCFDKKLILVTFCCKSLQYKFYLNAFNHKDDKGEVENEIPKNVTRTSVILPVTIDNRACFTNKNSTNGGCEHGTETKNPNKF